MHTSDTVSLPRFVLRHAAGTGIDPHRLAHAAGLPDWVAAEGSARVDSGIYPRLWELLAHETGDPDTTFRVLGEYRLGEFGLFDYLISTADTLHEGLTVINPYIGAVSTNFRFEAGVRTETESTFDLHMINAEGLGRDLSVQSGLGLVVSRVRQMTGRAVDPVRMTFQQRAPRSHDAFREFFGTTDLEFEADRNSVTYRVTDLELPHITADPMLAAVLRRHAATLPPPPPRATEWPDRVADALAQVLTESDPLLDEVARRLFTSPRTLQRRLHESGTTWRLEVDRARKRHVELLDSDRAAIREDTVL
ncbi:AraC family transcriptional regulator ligand-binding domain-containing protein [Nocardia sp. CDC160]|uniref:AraC family transcriptional regulator ligand-binding domain-containing protein n=1 Tax=Nocardia sp. CDC160 TaxID=3112166 RepID=UPI002DB94ADF|nr:AraC family transcriptional regulator ligand-binding domain-containing protein [Nocardia sp. CDC160]MEC3916272.1 AraC family transcriptional regulator ligand-binding domain-containing protein [Nocardia sp. CDC160]